MHKRSNAPCALCRSSRQVMLVGVCLFVIYFLIWG